MRRFALCVMWMLLSCAGALAQVQDVGLGGRTFVYGENVSLQRPICKEHTVYGYVIDGDSKESLIGANVLDANTKRGSVTNAYGYFSVDLPEGEVTLRASYIGYAASEQRFCLTGDTLLTIALHGNNDLPEVVVEADRPDTGSASSRMSALTVPVQQILRTPALLGEADVIKTLHLQPGVQSAAAGQVSMSVRGGNTDQNLFLLDGMLMYNVDHVMGFESAFMADAVKHVDFYRGSFSARYGGRLSSVTDVRTRDGDMQRYHGLFSIGLLSSHLSVEGPIIKDRTSFIVSARRTYADWLLKFAKLEGLDNLGLYFYDVNAKVNHRFSDSDRLYLSFYSGRDAINLATSNDCVTDFGPSQWLSVDKTRMNIHWGNTLYHARWNHIFSPKLFANVTAGYNHFKLGTRTKIQSDDLLDGTLLWRQSAQVNYNSGIDDFAASMDLDYHPLPGHRMRMGAQYTIHTFRPEIQSNQIRLSVTGDADVNETFSGENRAITAHESALYAEDDMRLGRNWQANAGLRAVLFSTDGKTFPNLEPRLSVSWTLGEGLRLKTSYTLMHQYVHKLQNSQIASPSDLWVPVTRDLKPMSGHQVALGFDCGRLRGWEFSAETFYKKMNHVIDFYDGATFLGNSKGWESKISMGYGHSYGVEFNVNKTLGKTTGMLNYTLARTERWYPDGSINGGRRFPYRYDRRHVVHLLVMHQLTKNIDLNATWNFASGALASVAKQQSEYVEPSSGQVIEGPYISARNNYRLAPTHQLDLGINFHHKTKHGERTWNVSLINVYRHLNQDVLYAEVKSEVKYPSGSGDIYSTPVKPEVTKKRVLKQLTIFPIVPSASFIYKF